ncbi:hypothetical protein GGR16_002072 [Chelatococcus caeni]|uniref:Uncharacterized protein n=1 Tax=Chelatococcus caeni TaxID=1348468 RepID=A0A840BWV0_9HYPH|nr:hypothetical protein [Chelatococcus caeni]MBB4017043.1 hypothetical protein [Chelatococcus caeni]
MRKPFEHDGQTYDARAETVGESVQIAIFYGGRRLYTLEIAIETLADMQTQPATEGTTIASLTDYVISDFKRLIDAGLLKI